MQIKACIPCCVQESCKINPMQTLDKLDRQILRSLQLDGRATYDQLAAAVGLSSSAAAHVSVQDCKTSFVLDRVKFTTAVPL